MQEWFLCPAEEGQGDSFSFVFQVVSGKGRCCPKSPFKDEFVVRRKFSVKSAGHKRPCSRLHLGCGETGSAE